MRRLALAFLLLAAVPASAASVLNRGNGAEPESLDPAFAGSAAETNILGDMMVGLTTLDAAARPMPGIAERWETSADGLTWTFHLRKARWSDGRPVTAQNFLFAWRRLLDPKTAARGAQLLWIIKNARAVTSGTMPAAALGATAPDPATLKIVLEHPAPYLPEILTLPAALPLPPKPSFRPGGYVCDGPYLLKSWQPGDHVALVKNPHFYDAASVKIDGVNYYPTADTQAALRRLRAGELDMQTPLPSAQLPWLRTNMPGSAHIMPTLALSYLAINLRDPALADIRVRRALNLVYDREAVAQKVMKLGELPAYAYVPPGVAGFGNGPQLDFRSMAYPARLAEARRLMQEAGFGPFNKLTLELCRQRQSRQPPPGHGIPGHGAADPCRCPHHGVGLSAGAARHAPGPVSAGLYQLAGGFQRRRQFPGSAALGQSRQLCRLPQCQIRRRHGGGRARARCGAARAPAAGGRTHRAGRYALAADPLSVAKRSGGAARRRLCSQCPRL